MKQNYILGAGPAGLIAAYYNKDYKVVDENPLGQLNMPFIPGPRLLQSTSRMKWFAKEIFPDLEIKVEHAVIGYHDKDGVYDLPDENFKKKYSLRTRGKSSEGSHLSEGKTEIAHIEFGDLGEDSYKELFKRLLKIIEERGQLIKTSVKSIDTEMMRIELADGTSSGYGNIVNTLNLNILRKLCPQVESECDKWKFDLTTSPKSFYKCEYGFSVDEAMKSGHPSTFYDYIYSIDAEWTRCTYFRDYMVYESTSPIKGDSIQGNKINMKFEDIPIQITNSEDIESVSGIVMLGRFAEWSHKVKANEVLDKVKEWEKNG
tara:strand:+ start:4731 stop:5681 length:951 start_codon:yes stop_codon:yes gene_type:complete